MAKNRYTVYYTETTLRMIEALEKEGHQQRDVINAGIVLFFKATDEQRGSAFMTANIKPKARLENAIETILKIDLEYLSEEDQKRVQEIRQKLGADECPGERSAETMP